MVIREQITFENNTVGAYNHDLPVQGFNHAATTGALQDDNTKGAQRKNIFRWFDASDGTSFLGPH